MSDIDPEAPEDEEVESPPAHYVRVLSCGCQFAEDDFPTLAALDDASAGHVHEDINP